MRLFVTTRPPIETFALLKCFLTLGSRPAQGPQGCSPRYCTRMPVSWYFTPTTVQLHYAVSQDGQDSLEVSTPPQELDLEAIFIRNYYLYIKIMTYLRGT